MPRFEQTTPIENENVLAPERSGVRLSENIPEEGEDMKAESVQAQAAAEKEAISVLERIKQLPDKSAGENNEVGLDAGERLIEAKKVLEKVDFSVIQNIFSEMYRKSGLQSEPSLIPPESIDVFAGFGGESNSDEKRLSIGADFAPWSIPPHQSHLNEWRGEKKFTRGRLRADVLSLLMHEQTHAVSKNVRREEGKIELLTKQVKSFFFGRQKTGKSSGYETRGLEKGVSRSRHMPFNEAVTDKIGEQVYDEYLKRTGAKQFFSDQAGAKYGEGYVGSRIMADIMIEVMSASLGVPADTVWESIIQGYMVGVDLDESELSKAFDEIFTPDLKNKIAKWEREDSKLPVEELHQLSKELVSSAVGQEKVKVAYEKYQQQLEIYRESQRII